MTRPGIVPAPARRGGRRVRADRKQFFPHLISGPFHHGLVIVFSMAMTVLVIAAGRSLLRGRRYVHDEHASTAEVTEDTAIGHLGRTDP